MGSKLEQESGWEPARVVSLPERLRVPDASGRTFGGALMCQECYSATKYRRCDACNVNVCVGCYRQNHLIKRSNTGARLHRSRSPHRGTRLADSSGGEEERPVDRNSGRRAFR